MATVCMQASGTRAQEAVPDAPETSNAGGPLMAFGTGHANKRSRGRARGVLPPTHGPERQRKWAAAATSHTMGPPAIDLPPENND